MGSADLKLNEDDSSPSPSAEAIVAEAQRRLRAHRQRGDVSRRLRWVWLLWRGTYAFSRHWLAVFNVLAGLYIGGAVLAPVLMHYGAERTAHVLYTFYSFFCHQYPFRSWFLFGPRFSYRLTEPIPVIQMNATRSFVGDPSVGYKIALCQRDVAIYGAVFVGGLVFALLRKRYTISPLPGWAYVVFGIMPMLLDGGTQWVSYFVWTFAPNVLPRPFETYPLMRTITGALFGLGSIGVIYPHFEKFFEENCQLLAEKLASIADIIQPEAKV